MKYATSTEAAAAFAASQEAKRFKEAARRKALGLAAKFHEPNLPRKLPLQLPTDLWIELVAHCEEFQITPRAFIAKMLEQAKLSRGGV